MILQRSMAKAFKFILFKVYSVHDPVFPKNGASREKLSVLIYALAKHHGIPKTTLVNPLTLYNVSDRSSLICSLPLSTLS